MRKKEILPFATAWTELEGIMPSAVNQTEKDKCCVISFMYVEPLEAEHIETETRMVATRG